MRTLLVGLGNASWLNEVASSKRRTTHTFSMLDSNYFHIVGGVDLDPMAAQRWGKFFNLKSFTSLEKAIMELNPTLIVIAVPINQLADCLIRAVKHSRSLIVIEKPVVTNLLEWERLCELLPESPRVIVNLPRLFAPETMKLMGILRTHRYAHLNLIGAYSGETLNTSLHFISLMNSFFPDLNWKRESQNDFTNFLCQDNLGRISAIFTQNSERGFSSFEFTIKGLNIDISYEAGGEEITCIEFGIPIPIVSTRDVYQRNVYQYLEENGEDAAIKIAGLRVIEKSILEMLS